MLEHLNEGSDFENPYQSPVRPSRNMGLPSVTSQPCLDIAVYLSTFAARYEVELVVVNNGGEVEVGHRTRVSVTCERNSSRFCRVVRPPGISASRRPRKTRCLARRNTMGHTHSSHDHERMGVKYPGCTEVDQVDWCADDERLSRSK